MYSPCLYSFEGKPYDLEWLKKRSLIKYREGMTWLLYTTTIQWDIYSHKYCKCYLKDTETGKDYSYFPKEGELFSFSFLGDLEKHFLITEVSPYLVTFESSDRITFLFDYKKPEEISNYTLKEKDSKIVLIYHYDKCFEYIVEETNENSIIKIDENSDIDFKKVSFLDKDGKEYFLSDFKSSIPFKLRLNPKNKKHYRFTYDKGWQYFYGVYEEDPEDKDKCHLIVEDIDESMSILFKFPNEKEITYNVKNPILVTDEVRVIEYSHDYLRGSSDRFVEFLVQDDAYIVIVKGSKNG